MPFDLTLTPTYSPTLNLAGDGGTLVLELATILRGETGATGEDSTVPGPGVPVGGTTGQVLAKASNADLDTEWVAQSGGGGGGNTNLGYTASATDGTVTSDSGTDATIPLADGTNAGLMTAAEKTKLSNTSGTNSGDQDLSGYSVTSHAHTGVYDPAGTAASAVVAHSGAVDPHGDRAFATSAANTAQSTAISTASADATSKADAAQAAAIAASTPAAHAGTGGTAHADVIAAGAAGFMTGSDKTKLDGIAAGATVAPTTTDALTEGSTNLYSTAARIRATLLTGLSLAAGTVVAATHSVLEAIGFLQKQVSDNTTAITGKQATLVSGTTIKTVNSTSLLGSGDLVVSAAPAGSTTQVQYNNAGAFGASSAFTYQEVATSSRLSFIGTGGDTQIVCTNLHIHPSGAYGNALFGLNYQAKVIISGVGQYGWASSTNVAGALADTTLSRNAAGVVEINNGTANTYRDLKLRNLISSGGVVTLSSFTVATLPSAATSGAGAMAYVTDANATTARSTVAAGGANKVLVFSDATNWLIAA